MLTNEAITKTLLQYGFTFEEVEYYIRNPNKLENILSSWDIISLKI